jgi:mycofactocin glycosyltransferase
VSPPPPDTPVPPGIRLTLDPSVKQLSDELWFGGAPPRVIRLTSAGRRAWAELQDGPIASRTAGRLARRLTDAGLAHPTGPVPQPPPELDVIVPAFGRVDRLSCCLAGLGRTHPVLVVDDGSPDPAAIAAVAARHGARLVRHERNRGPAAARNTGLAHTRAELVSFLDSDCVPGGDWVTPLLGHLADPVVAAAAPRIRAADDDGWAGRYARAGSSLDLGAEPARVAPGARVGYVPTAALLVRRAALADAARHGAVFDEALRVGEDVDLVWRLNRAGWRIRYDPRVQVGHREPRTWAGLLARRFRYGTSAADLAARHPDAMDPLALHPWPALTVAALLARRPVLAAAACAAAVTTMRATLRRADVPTAGLVPATLRAVGQTWSGIGRYATQFAAPALLVAIRAGPGRRFAAAALLLAPPLADWLRTRPPLDPLRFTAGRIADDVAYGCGVWAGCARTRSLRAVRPRLVLHPIRIDTDRS